MAGSGRGVVPQWGVMSRARPPLSEFDAPATFEVCGVPIAAVGLDGARDLIVESRFGEARAVHLCNAYTLSLAARDEEFRQTLRAGDLNFPDGHPVTQIGRRRGFSEMTARAYGPDLMLAVLDAGRQRGLRHYLYGGGPEVVEALAKRLHTRLPGIEVVGRESPPFRELTGREAGEMAMRIRSAAPDVVWVGLGTPRQDEFVASHAVSLGTTLVGVGAAFDFLAGRKPQAPDWMQRHGLEWAFRLASEPRRLWRRYLIGNTVFVYHVAREELALRRQARR